MTLPAFAAERRRRQPSIDISCPQGAQQQTRRTPLLLSIDGTAGRTDGLTLDRFIDPAVHNMQVQCQQVSAVAAGPGCSPKKEIGDA